MTRGARATLKDTPTPMPTALPTHAITIPSSGLGPISYAPIGGTGQRPFRPLAGEPEPSPLPASPASKPTKAQAKGIKTVRAAASRKKTLDDLLFSLQAPPALEAFCLFDLSRFKWFHEQEEEFDGPSRRWRLDLRGKPSLDKFLQLFRMRLKRKYPDGWFFYRWKLEFSMNARPVLTLHLLGDPGTGGTLGDATTYLTKAWLEVTGSDNPDLVTVQATHEASLFSFSSPTDPRLSPDLQRLLRGHYEFGQMHKARMPKLPPTRVEVTEQQLREVCEILADHHVEYAGIGRTNNDLLRMLNEANFGRAFINPVTGPKIRAVLGLEESGSRLGGNPKPSVIE